MFLKNVLLEVSNEIAVITIHRPEALNALNEDTFKDLEALFKLHLKNQSIKGCIIKGAGEKAFVAGADILEFENMTSDEALLKSNYGKYVFDLIETSQFPVVALIDGYALGGGMELALACHFRFATEQSKMGFPEVNLGILPGWGGTYRLQNSCGKSIAMELILTGDMITAERALALNMINGIFSSAEIENHCLSFIEKIASKSPKAVLRIMNYFGSNEITPYHESHAFSELAKTEEFKKGVQRFLKRI